MVYGLVSVNVNLWWLCVISV